MLAYIGVSDLKVDENEGGVAAPTWPHDDIKIRIVYLCYIEMITVTFSVFQKRLNRTYRLESLYAKNVSSICALAQTNNSLGYWWVCLQSFFYFHFFYALLMHMSYVGIYMSYAHVKCIQM
jgi:hypothetical protein